MVNLHKKVGTRSVATPKNESVIASAADVGVGNNEGVRPLPLRTPASDTPSGHKPSTVGPQSATGTHFPLPKQPSDVLSLCESSEMLAILAKFRYFIDELSEAIRSKRVIRVAECEKITELKNEIATKLTRMASEINNMNAKVESSSASLRGMRMELDKIKRIIDEHDKTVKKVDQLIVDHVVGAAEEKDKYRAFVEGVWTAIDTVYKRTLTHRATALGQELYAIIVGLIKGNVKMDALDAYFKELQTDAKTVELCQDHSGCWNQSIKVIHEAILNAFSGVGSIDAMSRKYDKCEFIDLLIIPNFGEKFDPAVMSSRQVDEGTEDRYAVESVLRLGLRKSSVKNEAEKAVVKVALLAK